MYHMYEDWKLVIWKTWTETKQLDEILLFPRCYSEEKRLVSLIVKWL